MSPTFRQLCTALVCAWQAQTRHHLQAGSGNQYTTKSSQGCLYLSICYVLCMCPLHDVAPCRSFHAEEGLRCGNNLSNQHIGTMPYIITHGSTLALMTWTSPTVVGSLLPVPKSFCTMLRCALCFATRAALPEDSALLSSLSSNALQFKALLNVIIGAYMLKG